MIDDLPPDIVGRRQAAERAGPWPRSGTLAEYEAAAERAVRAAHRCADLGFRWNMRFRLWEAPQRDSEAVELQAARLAAREDAAREIAEEREFFLGRMLTAEPAGRA